MSAQTDTPTTEKMLIGGDWVDAVAGETIDIITPTDRNQVIATTPRGRAQDVDRAVAAARKAFPSWAGTSFTVRQKALLAIADRLESEVEGLARLTALDTGNALRTQARPEAQTLVNLFRYFGGVAGEAKGVTLPAGDGELSYTRRQPLGVVGGILPWNSPLMIAGFKIPAALAAGNTLVIKAAEDAPLTIVRLAQILAEYLPEGVFNLVTGYGAEDTDFGRRLLYRRVPVVLVAGAHAYHRWHPVSDPPVDHLDDLLRNGAHYARRWGEWPAPGWFAEFERRGLVRRDGDDWVRASG